MNWHLRDISDARRAHVTRDRRLGAAQVEVAQRTQEEWVASADRHQHALAR
jgi:hypothetical protein